uniref:Putative secreted protein n=1 Tax=Rhipicephalus microplus TaxID=6941 RepID=A0A6G5A1G1_RHIMP
MHRCICVHKDLWCLLGLLYVSHCFSFDFCFNGQLSKMLYSTVAPDIYCHIFSGKALATKVCSYTLSSNRFFEMHCE